MTCAIFDFPAIAKGARLKALDGNPQNVVQPMTVKAEPVEFDPYGMYAGFVDAAPSTLPPGQNSLFVWDWSGTAPNATGA